MLLSAHQPAYLPWLPYFDKIRQADVFVVLDTVERSSGKDEWANKNRIKTARGPLTLTVPLKGSRNDRYCDIRIDDSRPWWTKHWKSISQAYSKAPYWGQFQVIQAVSDDFSASCATQLGQFLGALDIDTPIHYLSDLQESFWKCQGTGSGLILGICATVGADQFLFGPQGRNYCDFEAFERAGVEPLFQNYVPKPYPQLHGDFIPGLSALDLLLNCGESAKDFL